MDLCLVPCPVLPAQGAASPSWPVFHVLQPLVWALGRHVAKGVIKRKQTINGLWMGHRRYENHYFSVFFPAEAELWKFVASTSTSGLKYPRWFLIIHICLLGYSLIWVLKVYKSSGVLKVHKWLETEMRSDHCRLLFYCAYNLSFMKHLSSINR